MRLEKIEIKNYKSIEKLSFTCNPINRIKTFCLFGENESGKSSILNALELVNGIKLNYPDDYHDPNSFITVKLFYKPENWNIGTLKCVSSKILEKAVLKRLEVTYTYQPKANATLEYNEKPVFTKDVFSELKIDKKELKEDPGNQTKISLSKFIEDNHPKFYHSLRTSFHFWRPSDKFLQLDEIDLTQFSNDPSSISIPLLNSFLVSGIPKTDIKKVLSELKKPKQIRDLESRLSEYVTKHVRSIWKNHPIELKYEINNNKLSVLVEDEGIKHKSKTTGQRSDGFKRFLSILLTVSVDPINKNKIRNAILIDEPEIHLHPIAQQDLLRELKRIANETGHLVFYATHTPYLMDKVNLERNFKVTKNAKGKTQIKQLNKRVSTFAEINYEAFKISTTDYHNELYGYLAHQHRAKLDSLDKDRKWIKHPSGQETDVSLSTYIRHSIHHPENTLNRKFTEAQLSKSIRILRKLKYE